MFGDASENQIAPRNGRLAIEDKRMPPIAKRYG
jgi:hypothetical protein